MHERTGMVADVLGTELRRHVNKKPREAHIHCIEELLGGKQAVVGNNYWFDSTDEIWRVA